MLGQLGFQIKECLKESLSTSKLKIVSRLVPWVNGVNWSETNGLEKFKIKDKRTQSNGVAMAGPLDPKP